MKDMTELEQAGMMFGIWPRPARQVEIFQARGGMLKLQGEELIDLTTNQPALFDHVTRDVLVAWVRSGSKISLKGCPRCLYILLGKSAKTCTLCGYQGLQDIKLAVAK